MIINKKFYNIIYRKYIMTTPNQIEIDICDLLIKNKFLKNLIDPHTK